MSYPRIGPVDLAEATRAAVELSRLLGRPTVVCGGLALAAHGYQRETSDVDLVIPVVIGNASGDAVEVAAKDIGLVVRARHKFGGLDLRAGEVRIDVLTLDHYVPTLVPEAVEEAVASGRTVSMFGQTVFVVSVGHLIAMKIAGGRRKDKTDIVELIKVRLESGEWDREQFEVLDTVRRHLDWYVARDVENLAAEARSEMGVR